MSNDDDTSNDLTIYAREDIAMTQLLTRPPEAADPDAILAARAVIHGELGDNLEALEQLAAGLEDAEQEVREAFAALRAKINKRNGKVRAYGAGVRNWNRMLSTVSEVRRHMGDDEDEALAPLEYALPEATEWTLGDWPEDEWEASDICDPDGFDLGEIVGGLSAVLHDD
jgi:hypothetical protein